MLCFYHAAAGSGRIACIAGAAEAAGSVGRPA